MKVTINSIEFVLFNMHMPRDKVYGNHDLFKYIDVLNEVSDIYNKTASQYVVLGDDRNIDLSRDTLQTRDLRSFDNNEQMFFYVFMPNILIYLIHIAQGATAVNQK